MNMIKKSPLKVKCVQFYAYDCDEHEDLEYVCVFPFDDRKDLSVDKFFSGIAVRLVIENKHRKRGVDREISFSLMDINSRYELATQDLRVNIPKGTARTETFCYFDLKDTDLQIGHAYKLDVTDNASNFHMLYEVLFSIYGKWEACQQEPRDFDTFSKLLDEPTDNSVSNPQPSEG